MIFCQAVFAQGTRPPITPAMLNNIPDSMLEKGILSIKFREAVSGNKTAMLSRSADGKPFFNMPSIDALGRNYQLNAAAPAFTIQARTSKLETLHKQWGLNRWYQLRFPDTVNIKKIVAEYNKLTDLVEIAEPVYKKKLIESTTAANSVSFLPNDSRFNEQWSYNNTGQAGGTPGADIHLTAAWDIEKGNPNVIVAVVDQGIQVVHPDLAQNIWSGKGYNFVDNNSNIQAGNHGTHTSGTIAAVNNNGMGVSGIAGGDGSAGSGVRLMSCEVFGPSSSALNFGDALIWAADNGAAIAQNSWGYSGPDVYEQTVLDAIDYFIANGGGAVMKGGIVIFAAGNDNKDEKLYPAAYTNVVSVAATNNTDAKGSYSNFGTWVSLAAPGGEATFFGDPRAVLSTFAFSNYGFDKGTSMACPHVSGVAALILSHLPNRVSPNDIKSILLNSTDDIYPLNPLYIGRLGTGRLNALKALQIADQIAQSPLVNPVSNFQVNINCPNIDISWTKNNSGDTVMLAVNSSDNFGLPKGAYTTGSLMNGGGTIAYIGTGNGFSQQILNDSITRYYKIWTIKNGTYSLGTLNSVETPYSLLSFTGMVANKNILLNWTKKCPANEVIVAFNDKQVFGIPAGKLLPGDTIPGGARIIYKGPANAYLHTSPIAGRNFYSIWPVTDSTYSFSKTIAVCNGSVASPVNEGFESGIFPPAGWSIQNPDGDHTWAINSKAAHTGSSSAWMNFWAYGNIDQLDYLLSPELDVTGVIDSAQLRFYHAYRKADGSPFLFNDTLMLQLSMDCGISYPITIWKKGGADLATNPVYVASNWVPVASDWKADTIDLKPYLPAGTQNFLVSFTGKNAFAQNLFIDDVSINIAKHISLDAGIGKALEPASHMCDKNFTPGINFFNNGTDTIKSLKLYFAIDKLLQDSVSWNGILLPNQSLQQSFKPYSVSKAGNYLVSFYTSSPNAATDQVSSNDTISYFTTIQDTVTAPLFQSFEQAAFPPAGWWLNASNQTYSWMPNMLGATDGAQSAWMRNYVFSGSGARDELYTAPVSTGNTDSIFMRFDLAYGGVSIPANPGQSSDTLEILLTQDCGQTFTSVYKKWGTELQTEKRLPSYSVQDTIGFLPLSKGDWRTDSINLSAFQNPKRKMQLVFRNINSNGNNLFIDNIHLWTITLSDKLKQNGFLISPNPTRGLVRLQHYQPPADLRALQLINAQGQLVWQQQYNGNAGTNIAIDLSAYAAGLYSLRMIYSSKTLLQRIVKIQ